jgi:hypothetical protein
LPDWLPGDFADWDTSHGETAPLMSWPEILKIAAEGVLTHMKPQISSSVKSVQSVVYLFSVFGQNRTSELGLRGTKKAMKDI